MVLLGLRGWRTDLSAQKAGIRVHDAGMDDDELRRDSAQVFDLATEIAAEYGASNMIKAEHAQELVRWGACEPHCIAAYIEAALLHRSASSSLRGSMFPSTILSFSMVSTVRREAIL